jgi:hypothetical protein
MFNCAIYFFTLEILKINKHLKYFIYKIMNSIYPPASSRNPNIKIEENCDPSENTESHIKRFPNVSKLNLTSIMKNLYSDKTGQVLKSLKEAKISTSYRSTIRSKNKTKRIIIKLKSNSNAKTEKCSPYNSPMKNNFKNCTSYSSNKFSGIIDLSVSTNGFKKIDSSNYYSENENFSDCSNKYKKKSDCHLINKKIKGLTIRGIQNNISKKNKLINLQSESLSNTYYYQTSNNNFNNFANINQISQDTPLTSSKTNLGTPKVKNLACEPQTTKVETGSFYCPFCEHCNKSTTDEYLDMYTLSVKEAKSIISRSFDYILNSQVGQQNIIELFNSYKDETTTSGIESTKEQSKYLETFSYRGTTKNFNKNSDNNLTATNLANKTINLVSSSKMNNINSNLNFISSTNKNDTSENIFIHTQIPLSTRSIKSQKEIPNLKKMKMLNPRLNDSKYDDTKYMTSENRSVSNQKEGEFEELGENSKNINKIKKKIPSLSQLYLNTSTNVFLKESLFKNFPKPAVSNRMTYQVLHNYLDSLLEDRVAIENLLTTSVGENFKNSLIAFGMSFNITENDGLKPILSDLIDVKFDQELDRIFDEKFKTTMKKILKKKNLANEIFPKNDPALLQIRRKFLYLFLVFIQILSEISQQHKEKATLIYKFFKIYFSQQESKWVIIINRFKDKITYYKNLCKLIIQQKNKNLDRVEKISDVLSQNRLSKENLEDHKNLIHDLLNCMNEKRDTIYLLNSKIEILENELKFWIYDWDSLKLDLKFREKFKNFNFESVAKNVREEMMHKQLSKAELSILINADVYLIISGQKNYFFDQKTYFISEIERLNKLFKKTLISKNKWKNRFREADSANTNRIFILEKELFNYREKSVVEKVDTLIQTDIDTLKMNKLIKNSESISLYKSLNTNKLQSFFDKIKFDCSTEKPLSYKSLLNLIADVYGEKISQDNKLEKLSSTCKKKFDVFFYEYMEEKFKIKKTIKKHCIETILSVIKYANEDNRVNIFRKFLAIGDKQTHQEIVEIYIVLLKSIPISFVKLFDSFESYDSYHKNSPFISTDLCFEIYSQKLNNFNFQLETKDKIIKMTKVTDINNKYIYLNEVKKFDYFTLIRFYNKSEIFIGDLFKDYKESKKTKEKLDNFIEPFTIPNKDFCLNNQQVENIFRRCFKINEEFINLDEFFTFFTKKYTFSIRISDFIEICYNNAIDVFNAVEKRLEKLFLEYDSRKNGMMYFKDFEPMMHKILDFKTKDNKWKINDYFM